MVVVISRSISFVRSLVQIYVLHIEKLYNNCFQHLVHYIVKWAALSKFVIVNKLTFY